MAPLSEIRNQDPGGDFHRCPNCGYARGFHCSFLRVAGGSARYRIVLICPECGSRFDIGWTAQPQGDGSTGP
jgi:hypothetical protein